MKLKDGRVKNAAEQSVFIKNIVIAAVNRCNTQKNSIFN